MKRLQRKRSKGHKMVADNGLPVVYVGRGSVWGNPYVVGVDGTAQECINKYIRDLIPYSHRPPRNSLEDFYISQAALEEIQHSLSGKNVSCWCKLCEKHKDGKPAGEKCSDCAPCHGDFLLDMASKEG